MSHFTVMVIGEEPEKQLQPFHEYECTGIEDEHVIFVEDEEYDLDEKTGKKGHWTNPNKKWDWYKLGGRWSGFLHLKNGATGTTGQGSLIYKNKPGIDQAKKGAIDFESMRKSAADKARETYRSVIAIIGSLPVNKTWPQISEEIKDNSAAKDEYWRQPRCEAWQKSKVIQDICGFFASPDEYLISEEEYVQNATDSALVTFAMIKDGQWYAKGEMGWFGMSTDKMTDSEWNKMFNKVLDELPDETLISIYDCHI